jgi:hypothetical protein
MSEPGNVPAAVRSQDSTRVYQTAKTQVSAPRPSLSNHLNTEGSMEKEGHAPDGSPQKNDDTGGQRYSAPDRVQHLPDENQGGLLDVTV